MLVDFADMADKDDDAEPESDEELENNSERFTNNFANSNRFAATNDSAATISVRRVTRKRKTPKASVTSSSPAQPRPNEPTQPPTSPTSSPSKRARKFRAHSHSAPCGGYDSSAMILLEKNRKGPRAHGLYQFVLWREALKAEKERVIGSAPATPLRNPKMNAGEEPVSHLGGRRLEFE